MSFSQGHSSIQEATGANGIRVAAQNHDYKSQLGCLALKPRLPALVRRRN